jgi:hypothetical protein
MMGEHGLSVKRFEREMGKRNLDAILTSLTVKGVKGRKKSSFTTISLPALQFEPKLVRFAHTGADEERALITTYRGDQD